MRTSLIGISVLCFIASLKLQAAPKLLHDILRPEQSWGGAELGYVVKNNIEAPEIRNRGFQFGVRGSFVYKTRFADLDLGLGWFNNKQSRDNIEVKTSSFFLSLVPQWEIGEGWMLGPALTTLLGRDVSFSDTGTNSEDRHIAGFLGLRAMKEESLEGYFAHRLFEKFRWGFQVQTDFTLSNRQVTWGQAILEFSIGRRQKEVPAVEPIQPVIVGKQIEEVPEPLPEKETRLNLKNAGVLFALAKTRLTAQSELIVEDIGVALAQWPADWESIVIEGHTDDQGSRRFNMKLSRGRAQAVKKKLVGQGVPTHRITTVGHGPDKPIAYGKSEPARAKNRRVEMRIFGLIQDSALEKNLRKIFAAYE